MMLRRHRKRRSDLRFLQTRQSPQPHRYNQHLHATPPSPLLGIFLPFSVHSPNLSSILCSFSCPPFSLIFTLFPKLQYADFIVDGVPINSVSPLPHLEMVQHPVRYPAGLYTAAICLSNKTKRRDSNTSSLWFESSRGSLVVSPDGSAVLTLAPGRSISHLLLRLSKPRRRVSVTQAGHPVDSLLLSIYRSEAAEDPV